MAVIFTMQSARSFDPLCQFTVYRASQVSPAAGLGIQTPCSMCVLPSVLCNLVQVERVWQIATEIVDWGYTIADSGHEALFESFFEAGGAGEYEVAFDTSQAACHWTVSDNDTAGGITGEVVWDLQVTKNADLIDLLLTVTINITGAVTDSHSVTYSLDSVDPADLGPHTLTCDTDLAGRTFDITGGSDQIIFPTDFPVTAEDPA